MKTFNTAGPFDPAFNYQLPPLERVPALMPLLRERQYVALSGPRQSGKASVLKALVDGINDDGWTRAVLLSSEQAGRCDGVETDFEAERRLVRSWHRKVAARFPEVS